MDNSIIVSIISAIVTIFTVVINTKISNNEMQHKLETAQAVTETKLEALSADIQECTTVMRQVPVTVEQVKVINHRISDLERDVYAHQRTAG